jgi:hypothetical protein
MGWDSRRSRSSKRNLELAFGLRWLLLGRRPLVWKPQAFVIEAADRCPHERVLDSFRRSNRSSLTATFGTSESLSTLQVRIRMTCPEKNLLRGEKQGPPVSRRTSIYDLAKEENTTHRPRP